MTAFISTNVPSAIHSISDDIIDAMYNPLFSELMNFVIHGAHNMERANLILLVEHNLERVADCVTNIWREQFMLRQENFLIRALSMSSIQIKG